MKRTAVVSVLFAASVALAAGQVSVGDRFDRALEAWNNGDYVVALEGFAEAVKSPDAPRYFDQIALLTGELYRVTELAPDGHAVRFSPSGRYAAFESGPRTAATTKVVDVERGMKPVAEVRGTALSFSPVRDAIVYLRTADTPEATKVRQEIGRLSALPVPDRAATQEQQRRLTFLDARDATIVVRDLTSGQETVVDADGMLKATPRFSADGNQIYFVGARETDNASNEIYAVPAPPATAKPKPVTSGPGFKTEPTPVTGGRYLVFQTPAQAPFSTGQAGPGGGGGGRGGGAGGGARPFGVLALADATTRTFTGSVPVIAPDGSALAFVSRAGSDYLLQAVKLAGSLEPATVKKSTDAVSSPVFSPDASRIAYSIPYTRNPEIFCVKIDGSADTRVTREIQPDTNPRFLTNTRLLAIKGEPRHSRSYVYDLDSSTSFRLFHNNTVRTIAPEYEWAVNPAGTRVLIVADRDGDTISPERGVYLVDLTSKITTADLVARIQSNLESERRLRATGEAMFKPIAAQVRQAVAQVSMPRLYEYQEKLFNFDSKYIGLPGNTAAGDYIYNTFKSFGYQPEYQWFTVREAKTANIIATLKGTENPELVYVLSSHYDSVQRGPGADDDDTGIAVLLETARVLARTPMPATIVFAAFTGEEAGDLGSREWVRQAVEKKVQVAGALNNDMIGWTNDYHLDNTIRFSNPGLRDLQHAASFLFSRMVTYDSRYFKSTDAAAFYEVYGDIVAGLGSYPVLGNPYYHQPTDLLETVNQQLVFEATKANIASAMGLSSSPARVKDVKVTVTGTGVDVTWSASPEKAVTGYVIAYGPASAPAAQTLTVKEPKATLVGVKVTAGQPLQIAVRAVTAKGMTGWDWARTTVGMTGSQD